MTDSLPPSDPPSPPASTRSQAAYTQANPEIQELLKAVLREEREVMHLKRRPDIHEKILGHIKRLVK